MAPCVRAWDCWTHDRRFKPTLSQQVVRLLFCSCVLDVESQSSPVLCRASVKQIHRLRCVLDPVWIQIPLVVLLLLFLHLLLLLIISLFLLLLLFILSCSFSSLSSCFSFFFVIFSFFFFCFYGLLPAIWGKHMKWCLFWYFTWIYESVICIVWSWGPG